MKTERQLDLGFSTELLSSAMRSDSDGPSWKTYRGYSVPTADKTLLKWLQNWLGPKLTFREVDGETPAFSPVPKDLSSGQFWTRNTSEFRSGAVVSSLSEILETGEIAHRYYLSPKACRGILRRAEKRGRQLLPSLQTALEHAARMTTKPKADT